MGNAWRSPLRSQHEPYVKKLCYFVTAFLDPRSSLPPWVTGEPCCVVRHTLEPSARLIAPWTPPPPSRPSPVLSQLAAGCRQLLRSSRSWAWRQSATWPLNTHRTRNPNDLARAHPAEPERAPEGGKGRHKPYPSSWGDNRCSREQPTASRDVL